VLDRGEVILHEAAHVPHDEADVGSCVREVSQAADDALVLRGVNLRCRAVL
jgi:hypothetical protein